MGKIIFEFPDEAISWRKTVNPFSFFDSKLVFLSLIDLFVVHSVRLNMRQLPYPGTKEVGFSEFFDDLCLAFQKRVIITDFVLFCTFFDFQTFRGFRAFGALRTNWSSSPFGRSGLKPWPIFVELRGLVDFLSLLKLSLIGWSLW